MVNRLPGFGDIRRIVAAFQAAYGELKKQDPNYKEKWRRDMYEHRFRNLFLTIIAVGLFGFFLMIGLFLRDGFIGPIQRWVLIGASSVFLLIGLITLVNYIVLIIRGR